MFFAERVTELTRKMLRKKLFVLLSKPIVPPENLQPFLSAHLEYMIDLEKRGLVFASGPLSDGEGPPSGPLFLLAEDFRLRRQGLALFLAGGDFHHHVRRCWPLTQPSSPQGPQQRARSARRPPAAAPAAVRSRLAAVQANAGQRYYSAKRAKSPENPDKAPARFARLLADMRNVADRVIARETSSDLRCSERRVARVPPP